MPVRTYDFRDTWDVAATPERVWALISDPTSYPAWWPIYLDARVVDDRGGVGSVAALRFRVTLPYTLAIETTCTRSEPPRRLEGTVAGDIEGRWRWSLEPMPDGGTRVVFEETVVVRRWLLALIAPLVAPLFALNHRVAAERGAKGMQDHLAAENASAAGTAGAAIKA